VFRVRVGISTVAAKRGRARRDVIENGGFLCVRARQCSVRGARAAAPGAGAAVRNIAAMALLRSPAPHQGCARRFELHFCHGVTVHAQRRSAPLAPHAGGWLWMTGLPVRCVGSSCRPHEGA